MAVQVSSALAGFFFVIVALSSQYVTIRAADPEAITDFVVPAGVNASTLDGSFFTSTLLRDVKLIEGTAATVTPVNVKVFPALEGLGVSFAMFQFPPQTINSLHIHPRASEILFVVEGSLDVGIIDSTNKMFHQRLLKGDLFVFPKGLVHFQINTDKHQKATALGGFSSSNPGLIRLAPNLFKSGISDSVLQKSFGVSLEVVKNLKAVN
ncbi:hypothetical protein Mapa_009083 [Marchantia paleacea]|nr:hypothetical protein Mapa_009083 [Marchantia paleacea]